MHNSLEITTLFAPRGIITDRHGAVLAENVEREDGSVARRYPFPSLSHVIGYVSYPKKDANGKIRSEGSIVRAEAGRPLVLSLDARLQQPFARALAAVVTNMRFIA